MKIKRILLSLDGRGWASGSEEPMARRGEGGKDGSFPHLNPPPQGGRKIYL